MSSRLSKDKYLKLKRTAISSLILFINSLALFFSVLKGVFWAVFEIFKPFLRLFFYKVIVKGYCKYTAFLRVVGWDKRKKTLLAFLLNEKTIHVLVIFLTLLVVSINLTQHTSAKDKFKTGGHAIVSDLVSSEFGGEKEVELIEETLGDGRDKRMLKNRYRYVEKDVALGGHKPAISPSIEKRGSESSISSDEGLTQQSDSDVANEDVMERDEVVEYKVKTGDTISTIASKFGVSVNTILWENDLTSYELIKPGDTLTILPTTGVRHEVESGDSLHYIADQYDVETEKITKANNINNVASISIGEELIIPDGEKLSRPSDQKKEEKKEESKSHNAITVVKDIVKPKKQTTSNKMFWPTEGHRITQYYSWRHHGLDIANNVGTPLYSADAGTVEFVGWSNGYGNNIIVNHGGGKKTRYAHMHKFYVKRGQRVSKGQTLGEMGNTGWSTGPHIHFEVIINGKRYNPLNYIK